MPQIVTCPNGHRLKLKALPKGKSIKCPACSANFPVGIPEPSVPKTEEQTAPPFGQSEGLPDDDIFSGLGDLGLPETSQLTRPLEASYLNVGAGTESAEGPQESEESNGLPSRILLICSIPVLAIVIAGTLVLGLWLTRPWLVGADSKDGLAKSSTPANQAAQGGLQPPSQREAGAVNASSDAVLMVTNETSSRFSVPTIPVMSAYSEATQQLALADLTQTLRVTNVGKLDGNTVWTEIPLSGNATHVLQKDFNGKEFFVVLTETPLKLEMVNTQTLKVEDVIPVSGPLKLETVLTAHAPDDPFIYFTADRTAEPEGQLWSGRAGRINLLSQETEGPTFCKVAELGIAADGETMFLSQYNKLLVEFDWLEEQLSVTAYHQFHHMFSVSKLMGTDWTVAATSATLDALDQHHDTFSTELGVAAMWQGQKVSLKSINDLETRLTVGFPRELLPSPSPHGEPPTRFAKRVWFDTPRKTAIILVAGQLVLLDLKTLEFPRSLAIPRELPYRIALGEEVRLPLDIPDGVKVELLPPLDAELYAQQNFNDLWSKDRPVDPQILASLDGRLGQLITPNASPPTLEGNVLVWKPSSNDLGLQRLRFRASFEDESREWSWETVVHRPFQAFDFRVEGIAGSNDNSEAVIWGTKNPTREINGRFRQDPQQSANSQFVLARVTLPDLNLVQKVDIQGSPVAAAIHDGQAYVCLKKEGRNYRLEHWDLLIGNLEQSINCYEMKELQIVGGNLVQRTSNPQSHIYRLPYLTRETALMPPMEKPDGLVDEGILWDEQRTQPKMLCYAYASRLSDASPFCPFGDNSVRLALRGPRMFEFSRSPRPAEERGDNPYFLTRANARIALLADGTLQVTDSSSMKEELFYRIRFGNTGTSKYGWCAASSTKFHMAASGVVFDLPKGEIPRLANGLKFEFRQPKLMLQLEVSQSVSYKAEGATEYLLELRLAKGPSAEPLLRQYSPDGSFSIDLSTSEVQESLVRWAKRYLAIGPKGVEPKKLDAYLKSFNSDVQELLKRTNFQGVPIPIRAVVAADDGMSTDLLMHEYFVDVPLSRFIEKPE